MVEFCYNCGKPRVDETEEKWPPGHTKDSFCGNCYTGWLADRDQKYAEYMSRRRAECRENGHACVVGMTLEEMARRFKVCPCCGENYTQQSGVSDLI